MATDPGMSIRDAEALCQLVRDAGVGTPSVEPDGEYFVVVVRSASGIWTLYDEDDWAIWRERMTDS